MTITSSLVNSQNSTDPSKQQVSQELNSEILVRMNSREQTSRDQTSSMDMDNQTQQIFLDKEDQVPIDRNYSNSKHEEDDGIDVEATGLLKQQNNRV